MSFIDKSTAVDLDASPESSTELATQLRDLVDSRNKLEVAYNRLEQENFNLITLIRCIHRRLRYSENISGHLKDAIRGTVERYIDK